MVVADNLFDRYLEERLTDPRFADDYHRVHAEEAAAIRRGLADLAAGRIVEVLPVREVGR